MLKPSLHRCMEAYSTRRLVESKTFKFLNYFRLLISEDPRLIAIKLFHRLESECNLRNWVRNLGPLVLKIWESKSMTLVHYNIPTYLLTYLIVVPLYFDVKNLTALSNGCTHPLAVAAQRWVRRLRRGL